MIRSFFMIFSNIFLQLYKRQMDLYVLQKHEYSVPIPASVIPRVSFVVEPTDCLAYLPRSRLRMLPNYCLRNGLQVVPENMGQALDCL